ncbi:MAG: alpha/beta hydrolase [Gemmataceae bacterium]
MNEVRIPLSTLFDQPAPANGVIPTCATKLTLAHALARLDRDAAHGYCDTGRYRPPFYVWGEGPPLVFIPGLADDRLSFALVISRLSQHFCCVAYDLPGGKDDGARLGRLRHADLVADLFALLDSLRLSRAHLFGSSFGSTIALAAAHARPERVERIVLAGGFARRPLALGENVLTAFARYWPWSMGDLPLRDETLKLAHGGPFRRQPPEVWDWFLTRSGSAPMAAVARRARILNRLDLRPILPAIRHPVMMICGDRDPLVGKDCEAELLHGLPHVSRAEIEDCGHMPQFTHPEILAEIIERYLGVKDGCSAPDTLR